MKCEIYICKTPIDVQPLINIQSSNPCPNSMSQTSAPQIYVLFTNSQIGIQFSNRHPILKSMAISRFLKSIPNNVTDICLNPNQ